MFDEDFEMNRKSLSQLNSRTRRNRAKKFVAVLSAIAVFVTTYALILPAITIDNETAENEPGLDVVQEVVEELVPPASEPGVSTDDISRSASCGDLTVGAELTDGSFGESVVMELTALDDLNVLNAAVAAVDGINNREADKVRAVEISFTDENGEDGTPDAPMNITLSGEAISDASDPVIVRVDEDGSAEIVEDSSPSDDFVYLAGESNSIYAIVETHEITTRYITADGETYVITVKYDTTAGIPDGAELAVSEICPDTNEALYEELFQNAAASIDADRMVNEARFFDISIMYEGAEIEPSKPVEVTIEYADPIVLNADSELLTVHFTENGTELNRDVEVTSGETGGTAVTFEQDGFSYTGTLITSQSQLTNNDRYWIVAVNNGHYYALNADGTATELNGTMNGTQVTITSPVADEPDPTFLWRYNNNTLRNVSTNQYLYMGNTLMSSTSRSLTFTNRANNTISVSWRSGGTWVGTTYSLYFNTNNNTYSRNSNTYTGLYFVRANPQYKLRLHYIDENGNEISDPGGIVVNFPYTEDFDEGDLHRNIYAKDIPGYQFMEARYGDEVGDRFRYVTNQTSNGNIIVNFKNELMRSATTDETGTYNNSTQYIKVIDRLTAPEDSPAADVYMVYKSNDTPGPNEIIHQNEGGGDDPGEFPFGAPDHNKRLVPNYTDGNWDGTYTLYLDVTGQAAATQGKNKADIILIYDTSNSMHASDAQIKDEQGNVIGTTQRYKMAYDVVMDMAEELYANNANDADPNDPTVRIGVVSYATTGRTRFNYVNSYSEFENGFAFANQDSTYQTGSGGGTNWEDGLQLAQAMYDNYHRDDAEQYIIFVSDGEPTVRASRGDYYKLLQTCEYANTSGGVLTDSTNGNRQHYAHGFGELSNNANKKLYTTIEHCYTHAKDDAKYFVDNGATFYSVGIFNAAESLSRMNTLANYAYTGLDYPNVNNDNYKYADNEQILHETFADIIQNISKNFTYGHVDIMDQMTATTLTTGEISGAGNAVDFKYYKNPAGGTLTEWQGAPAATYNPATRSVDWDLDSIGALEDGVTYTIGFTVWPDQDAYDAIMLLNDLVDGGVDPDEIDAFAAEHYPTIAPLLRKDPSGHYIVQSNANAVLSYERLVTENGETTSLGPESAGYSYPNMETTSHYMRVSKYWQDSLQVTNRFQSVVFAVYQDYDDTPGATNTPYTYVTLDASDADPNDSHAWVSDEIEISPGIFKTEIDPNNPINPGHTYTVREIAYTDANGIYHEINSPEDYTDYRYEFNPEDVTPMLYDGVMTLMGDANEDQRLTGVNALRGGINLYKIVLGRDGEQIYTDDEYEFIFNYTVPDRFIWGYDDVTGDPIYDPNAYPVWYTMYTDNDRDGVYTGDGDTNSTTNGLPDLGGGWGTLYGGEHVKIRADQMIRVINVPIGTQYTFEEINVPEGWEFQEAEVYVEDGLDVSVVGPTDGHNIIGSQVYSNTAHEVVFVNRMTHYEIKVIKVDEDNNEVHLPGAVFEVYSAPGQDPNDLVTINGQTQHTTDANGYISLGEDLPNGTYYLYEVSPPPGYAPLDHPIVVTVADSGVTYEQTGYNNDEEQTAPLVPGEDAPVYIVTVFNTPTSGLQIIKVNAADPTVVLAGAVFNLYKAPDGVSEEDLINSTTGIVDKDLLTIVSINDETDLTSNSNGVISLGGNLPPGVYYLFEITPPTGFAAPKDPVKITVNGTTVTYSQKDYNAGQTMTATLASSGNDPPALTIFVANTTGIELPHTGGAGTFMYTFGGITLMCIAVLTYGIGLKRKKRERRNE